MLNPKDAIIDNLFRAGPPRRTKSVTFLLFLALPKAGRHVAKNKSLKQPDFLVILTVPESSGYSIKSSG